MAGDERLESYRLNAEKCLKLAQTFKDFDAKRTMLAMADAWLMLAAHRANNTGTIDADGPPPLSEPPTPPVNLHLDPAKPDDPMQC